MTTRTSARPSGRSRPTNDHHRLQLLVERKLQTAVNPAWFLLSHGALCCNGQLDYFRLSAAGLRNRAAALASFCFVLCVVPINISTPARRGGVGGVNLPVLGDLGRNKFGPRHRCTPTHGHRAAGVIAVIRERTKALRAVKMSEHQPSPMNFNVYKQGQSLRSAFRNLRFNYGTLALLCGILLYNVLLLWSVGWVQQQQLEQQ